MNDVNLIKKNSFFRVKSKLKRILTKLVIVCLVLALVFAGLLKFNVIKLGPKTTGTVQQNTAKVTKGTLSDSLTGSGTIYSADIQELIPIVSGKITKMYFKVGDTVKKGDLIYEIDDTDAQTTLEQAKNNLLQAQLSAAGTVKSLSTLTLKAPFSGQVTNIIPQVGDDVQKNGSVLTVTDLTKMKLTVQFNASLINEIYAGQKAVINIQDIMQSVDGVISYKGSKPYSTSSGGEVFYVEITLENPGSLKDSMYASVDVETTSGVESSTNTGKLGYINSKVLKSDAGGNIKTLNVKENDFVEAGDVIADITNDDIVTTNNSNNLKIEQIVTQIETAEKQLSYYKIYSPIDGLIVEQKAKIGDKVGSSTGSSTTVPCTIIDNKNFKFDVSIDELDIEKIKLSQKVSITVDAVTATATTPLNGEVVNAALQGTSSNGVSTYPITIRITDPSTLKSGMNATAEIIINQKTDVLMVPLEAIQKMGNRSLVWVKSSGSNAQNGTTPQNGMMPTLNGNASNGNDSTTGNNSTAPNGNGSTGNSADRAARRNAYNRQAQSGSSSNRTAQSGFPSGNMPIGNSKNAGYYSNAVLRMVEVGISNETYTEIISGLTEGETVVLPAATANSTTTNTNGNALGGVMRMGGGIPSGGFSRQPN